MTAPSVYHQSSQNMVAVWVLLCLFPLLLAAELAQQSRSLSHLPDQESYRSNLSDRVFQSSTWRQPLPQVRDWRETVSPQIEWRTDTTQQPSRDVELQHVDLYPQYRPGGTSTFDLSTREDQSGFKVIEFDFGR